MVATSRRYLQSELIVIDLPCFEFQGRLLCAHFVYSHPTLNEILFFTYFWKVYVIWIPELLCPSLSFFVHKSVNLCVSLLLLRVLTPLWVLTLCRPYGMPLSFYTQGVAFSKLPFRSFQKKCPLLCWSKGGTKESQWCWWGARIP